MQKVGSLISVLTSMSGWGNLTFTNIADLADEGLGGGGVVDIGIFWVKA